MARTSRGAASDDTAPALAGRQPAPAGLTTREADALLARHGPNLLVPERRRTRLLLWLLRPLVDPMTVLLLVAGAIYAALGDRVDAIVVLAALAPIAAVTLVLESRSERALERLRRLTAPTVTVLRDGARAIIPADRVVPGDLLYVAEGDVIPADGALVGGGPLVVDESALTGESLPAERYAARDDVEDGDELFAGTTVLSGHGAARVTVTGARTRYGRVGTLVAEIEQPRTPLERSARRLVVRFGAVAAVACLAVAAIEFARGAGWAAAAIAGVSLAIAAIPEEFPMVYTLYLSVGAWRLARGKALVRRLAGVETLGSTTVICADKTGTLTMGHLELLDGVHADGTPIAVRGELGDRDAALLRAAVLACEPRPFDPMDQAILRFAMARGLDVEALHRETLVHDYPFDPAHRYMSHVWRHDGVHVVVAKGAIEGILARSRASEAQRAAAQEANQRLASRGMRVIAVAAGELPHGPAGRDVDERALRYLGLVAFSDPLRPGVTAALEECRRAGIRVIMITGDHPVTAHAVADGLGLPHVHGRHLATGEQLDRADDAELARLLRDVNIFARTRPEQKYRIVRALRAQGHVVAMTGDGINDAPALREADIGIAMGSRGTEVAREAATLVLLDDNFATIVAAVRNGRRIYDNLQRAFAYLLAFHVPLVLTALVVPLAGAPLLLLPVQLVWLELVVHPTASLVFEGDPGATDLMTRPPRPTGGSLLAEGGALVPMLQGVVLTVGVLALYLGSLAMGAAAARGAAFAALLLGQVGLVLEARAPRLPAWCVPVRGNRMIVPVLLATIATLVLALHVPALAAVVKVAPIGVAGWGGALAVALAATLWVEPVKAWRRRKEG
ncbi:MAG TPA: cation-translocating P-type ATPase [Gemmatimonadaceae bacterium]|nr:cation-translocating P-type ATPase [Gemmatimonadaceae bacterium]